MAGRVIGFGGYAQSGKDALADFLTDDWGWLKTYMSMALEEALLRVNPWVNVNWDNWVVKDGVNTWPRQVFADAGLPITIHYMRYRDLHRIVGYAYSKNNNDVRDYLQKLGTEVGRNMCDEDVWVRWGFRAVDEAVAAGRDISITGMRYPNELDWLRRRGGLAVWVRRPGYGPVNTHTSDNALGPDDFDMVVDNDGTLKDLCIWAGILHRQDEGALADAA